MTDPGNLFRLIKNKKFATHDMKENLYPFAGKVGANPSHTHKIVSVSNINATAFILRLERKGLDFLPGQYISLGMPEKNEMREYSIFSAVQDDWLEVLIREVEDGSVSKSLRKLKQGDNVKLDGPFGFFTIPKDKISSGEFLFIASGTGVSPFNSIIRSQPPENYRLIHGVRNLDDAFLMSNQLGEHYIPCTSRQPGGTFHGRVSDWLKQNPVKPETLCYLCGNCEMIYDCFDILESQGVAPENLHAEVYF
jgi:ferredoxin/flavodoxin---NADP+ reductase